MHSQYFPPCPVDGPIEPPVPFGHMGSRGAVPKKCSECKHLFEGECTRYFQDVGHYLHLDHGACGIEGPTDPMWLRDEHIEAKVEVPRKCARCRYLKYVPIFGFVCSKDADKWGDFYRGLDWGNWKPDNLFLQLPFPKITTKDLSKHANKDDLIQFIKEYRRVNPGTSIEEVKNDFFRFREILTKQLRDHSESE